MNRTLVGILAAMVGFAGFGVYGGGDGPFGGATPAAGATVEAAEVVRIQTHLAEVERELLAADVSGLSEAQRLARAGHIEVLREYREQGVFPHNHDFPRERVPYFVDEHGTRCAMAYLIERSGRADLVQRVTTTANNARIADLAGDLELQAWLEEAGLTVGEAARIQPAYGCCWIDPYDEETGSVSLSDAVASAVTTGFGGAAIGLNLRSLRAADGSRWAGVMGITAGVAGIAVGIDGVQEGGDRASLGALTAGVGLSSAVLGTWNLFRIAGKADVPIRAQVSAGAEPPVSATPLLFTDAEGAPGVGVHVRF